VEQAVTPIFLYKDTQIWGVQDFFQNSSLEYNILCFLLEREKKKNTINPIGHVDL
jgi:hypothetical protein